MIAAFKLGRAARLVSAVREHMGGWEGSAERHLWRGGGGALPAPLALRPAARTSPCPGSPRLTPLPLIPASPAKRAVSYRPSAGGYGGHTLLGRKEKGWESGALLHRTPPGRRGQSAPASRCILRCRPGAGSSLSALAHGVSVPPTAQLSSGQGPGIAPRSP